VTIKLCRYHVRERLGLPSDGWKNERREKPFEPAAMRAAVPADPDDDAKRRIERAREIWAASVDPRGTAVEIYLASRSLKVDDDIAGNVIRFHPACPWKDEKTDKTIFVLAMIAAMRRIDGDALSAIHRTRLSPYGVKLGRRMLGIAARAAVKLDADDAVIGGLHIAEGVESAMAARELGLKPAWALGSCGAIASFPILSGIGALSLLREPDDANKKAADVCAMRWHSAGREVFDVWPNRGNDVNDAIKGPA
jgi:putative DNA primase/helicase